MTDQSYTHISYLLDRSGSMASIRGDTIGGFNRFMDDQKAVPGRATISLMQFDTEFEYLRRMEDLSTIKPIGTAEFVPRGSTALRDAICKLIDETGKDLESLSDDKRPGKVIFVIQTDGLENSSKHNSVQDVNDRITRQQKEYQWQFVFLGANQDAIATGEQYGIPQASAMTLSATPAGTRAAYQSTSDAVRSYRSGVTNSVNLTDDDRKAQEEAENKT